jgi:ribosomal protein L37AE/L43A
MAAPEEQSKFFDCFGRELEAHTCEYCGKTKPVALWNGIKNCRETFQILMVEYLGYNERKMWRCVECSNDIKNKLEGKEV